ncbi:unnamed protein product [Medioppia subpectinata]|uniref:Retinoblastoma-like protein n=1 Tax=Medioppia subpectinata TaxID=1979941 RepID=A0A7R9PTQ3_9ACAR|nr:unnamed protein product [Medioppia subpectinata]CAG2100686.1 unnamed protein product [Medioppia subpectinata]
MYFKHIMKEYDQFVLNIGDFDERIFLNENATEELGTPQSGDKELAELVQTRHNSKEHPNPNSLVPTTPLTNRQYLSQRPNITPMTPIASAMNSVSRLQSILLDRKDEPNDALESIFKLCIRNPKEKIQTLLKAMGDRFLNAYNNDMQSSSPASRMLSTNEEMGPPSPTPNAQNDEFAKKRLKLSISFYYKSLENILLSEKKRIPAEKLGESLTTILEKDSFHLSLFTCSLEIVLFSYNSPKQTFPWVLDVFSEGTDLRLHAFNFYKVIEPIIREEDGLSRDVVKHLNSIEEKILESMAWKSDSPLWDLIRANATAKTYVPSCLEVSLPMNNSGSTPSSVFNSPVSHLKKHEIQFSTGSITDRFSSPFKSTAKRQLFGSMKADAPTTSTAGASQMGHIVQMMIPANTQNGERMYIQVPAIALTIAQQNTTNQIESPVTENGKPVKSGPIGLFFRKVYTMAGLRLRDLCERLNICDEDIRKKIWTCFEHSLRQHTDLMRDRHLDQIIMCAFYAISKVTKQSQTFQDIMKCYRLQPQAASHVYRSVLMSSIRRRRNSGSSDTSRNSGSSSPLMQEEKDRIRSSSTLPVPHPNSQPPTPTRVAGTGSQFEFEERGDVIMFYNNVYLPELTVKYIMKFSPNISESPPLSPLPRLNANQMSPYRRISQRFPLYISPLKTANFPPSPNRPLSYRFQSSPAKDLRAINNMMRSGSPSQRVSKRILQDDIESENSPTKRQCTEKIDRKIRDIVSERQSIESNGALNNSNGSAVDSSND